MPEIAQPVLPSAAVAHQESPSDALNEQVFCICGSEIDDNQTIQCDRCGRWQHMPCMNIDPQTDDLDNLTYYCHICEPRALDVAAAKRYIESVIQEERQLVKARRATGSARGKGSRQRGGSSAHHAASSTAAGERQSPPRQHQIERGVLLSGHRDYNLIEDCVVSESAARYITDRLESFAICPADAVPEPLSTAIRTVGGAQVRYGLFAERPAPAGALVGSYLGVVDTRDNYKADERNSYAQLLGPRQHVVFVDSTDLAIDARQSGNVYRYLRKSCLPNCSVVPLAVAPKSKNDLRVLTFTIVLSESVAPGTELTVSYGWPEQTIDKLPGMGDMAAQIRFAQTVQAYLGDCACGQAPHDCQVAKYLPALINQPSNNGTAKRAASDESQQASPMEGDESTEPQGGLLDAPLSREERKIQMAIARMEQTDAQPPKPKRRRRNTGDELSSGAPVATTIATAGNAQRPGHSRRPSSVKEEPGAGTIDAVVSRLEDLVKKSESREPSQAPELPRTATPPTPAKARARPTKLARLPRSNRASLISSPTPAELLLNMPRKQFLLQQYLQEQERAAAAKRAVEQQAKEAAAKLERQQAARRQAAALAEKEAKAAQARKEEAARIAQEREAKEASQRAREREIWGDFAAPASDVSGRPGTAGGASAPHQPLAVQVALANGAGQANGLPASPGVHIRSEPGTPGRISSGPPSASAMGPPALPTEKPSSPATPLSAGLNSPGSASAALTEKSHSAAPLPPKIVRKLSVSEYLKQRKEQQAAKPSSPAPQSPAEPPKGDDDQSDGEVVDAPLSTQTKSPSQALPSAVVNRQTMQARPPPMSPTKQHSYHPGNAPAAPSGMQPYLPNGAPSRGNPPSGPPPPSAQRPMPPHNHGYGAYPPPVSPMRPYGWPPQPYPPGRGPPPPHPGQHQSQQGPDSNGAYGPAPPTGPRGHPSSNMGRPR